MVKQKNKIVKKNNSIQIDITIVMIFLKNKKENYSFSSLLSKSNDSCLEKYFETG